MESISHDNMTLVGMKRARASIHEGQESKKLNFSKDAAFLEEHI